MTSDKVRQLSVTRLSLVMALERYRRSIPWWRFRKRRVVKALIDAWLDADLNWRRAFP